MIYLNKDKYIFKKPFKKKEKWRYSDLNLLNMSFNLNFDLNKYSVFITQDKNFYYIVLINGQFVKTKSSLPKNAIEVSFIQDNIVNLSKKTDFKKKYYVLKNISNIHNIIFINVNSQLGKSIKLIKLAALSSIFFTTFFILKSNSCVTLHEDFIHKNQYRSFINNLTRISMDSNANCRHFIKKNFYSTCKFVNILEVVCGANSVYRNYSINFNDKSYRFEAQVYLNKKSSLASFNGVNIAKNYELYDIILDIKHNASNTTSKQFYNQVLNNKSICSLYSNIEISKALNKVEAHQLNKNLLIDENSVVYSRPILNIHSDDIICSHGSTTGNIDKNILCYFASRGIYFKHAKNMIIISLLKSVFIKCDLSRFEIMNLHAEILYNIL